MFVRVKTKPNGKKAIQIVETHRRADKVHQRIVRHLGQAVTDREVEEMKALAQSIIDEMSTEREPFLPLFNPEKMRRKAADKKPVDDVVKMSNLREEQRIIDGIGDVFGKLYDDLNFQQSITGTRQNPAWNDVLKNVVLARLANPASKRRTASLLERDYAIKIPLERIYRMMDRVASNEERIKQQVGASTLSLFKEDVDVLFFDVTTLYFESFEADNLRVSGFSKDNKFKETQVVLALVATTKGMPVTYRLYPGNTYEGNTLVDVVEELQQQYHVQNVLLVADRGMFNEKNLARMDELSVNYIVGAKLRTLSTSQKEEILTSEYRPSVVSDELHWIKEFVYKERRLICGYSSKRARKDAADRQRLIERLLKKQRSGKLKLSELIPNYGTKKYISVKGGSATLNEKKIESDAAWDGVYGVVTNANHLEVAEILSRYRGLWQIEDTFRLSKHELKMRPIYHWNEQRIRAHISICFLALAVARQATYRISLQQQMAISFEQIREELLHVQSSILVDISSKKKYLLPSKVTTKQKKIYRVFGLKRRATPRPLQ